MDCMPPVDTLWHMVPAELKAERIDLKLVRGFFTSDASYSIVALAFSVPVFLAFSLIAASPRVEHTLSLEADRDVAIVGRRKPI